MTKPANFPERKRQRQIGALERLSARSTPEREYGETEKQFFDRSQELAVLADATAKSLRDVRTKKYRG